MKASIEQTELFRAMGRVQSIVERRTTIPILSNVLIETRDDHLFLRTTDLDIEVLDKVKATVEIPGALTVGANTLYEIVKKLPDGSLIQLSADSGSSQLEISASRSRFFLSTLPKEDFPIMASEEYENDFTVKAKVIKRLFDKSKFAMSSEETRYYLNGVYLHPYQEEGKNFLRAVATDGHRLAQIDVETPGGLETFTGVIVPKKTVSELRMVLETENDEISISISSNKIRISNETVTLTSKVVDGTFPDYKRVIPVNNEKKLIVNATEFSEAVDRVSTVSSDRSRAVKLSLSSGKLHLSVNSPENGKAEDELLVDYSDDTLEIGFNARYLQELTSQVDGDRVEFSFKSSGDPALMRDVDDAGATYVVMPMRV
jgi:DNA polymerase-3 subunit beta